MIDIDLTESELHEKKKSLNENINKKNILDDRDTYNLQKLLTFIEMPSFIKDTTRNHVLLPDIIQNNSLVNSDTNANNLRSRKSIFMQSDNSFKRNKSQINHHELRNILEAGIHIDKNLGFLAINPELAVGLRQLTYGSLKHSFSMDWRKSYFSFKNISGQLCYSLYSEKNAARSLIVCVQGYVLKALLYSSDTSNGSRARLLKVSENKRMNCLITALADILWTIGEEKKAFVCLSSSEMYVESSPYYTCDEITETIQIFKFKSYDKLKKFLTTNINYFTTRQRSGCILFLYSIALSRGLQELLEDFEFDQSKSLLTYTETLSQSAINLILTGYATEFLHNGVQYDANKVTAQFGIKKRSDIGFLQYNSPEESSYPFLNNRMSRRASDSQTVSSADIEQLYVVGSMLKTPNYPIWVINGNKNFGILFSLNDELLSHWRAENNFQLQFLNCLPSQQDACILSICSRRGRTAKFRTNLLMREETKRIPILNHVINTKWYGCRIDWNTTQPFI